MKTFIEFCGDNKKELPAYAVEENTKRAAIARWAYPDAAVRAQYPDLYFTPIAADALFKLGKK